MSLREVHILGYPTNKASSGGFSESTPFIFEKIVQPLIAGKYGVVEKFEMVSVDNNDSPEKNGINNYKSVYTSVENLFTAEAKNLWCGAVPIAIGGDHSQGLPTVKAALLVSVLKELTSQNSNVLNGADKQKLHKLADENKFIEAAKNLHELIRSDKKIRAAVKAIINKIHIIWIDAHGDFNTKNTSESGNFHGMSLAAACGLDAGGLEDIGGKYIRLNPRNVHIMCARDLDEKEEKILKKFGVDFERFEMHDSKKGKIRAKGQPASAGGKEFHKVFAELVSEIKNKGDKIILSMDIDHLPFPETGTPLGAEENVRKNRFNESPMGPTPSYTYSAYSNLAHDQSFIAFDITEVAIAYISSKTNKKVIGTKALRGGINILASLIGGDEARLSILTQIKKQGSLLKRVKELRG